MIEDGFNRYRRRPDLPTSSCCGHGGADFRRRISRFCRVIVAIRCDATARTRATRCTRQCRANAGDPLVDGCGAGYYSEEPLGEAQRQTGA